MAAGACWAGPASAEPEAGPGGPATPAQRPKYEEAQQALTKQGVDFCYEIYQVQAGDTVENIAARFGVRASSIRQFNDLGGEGVTEGEAIAIPLSARPAPKRPTAKQGLALNLIEPRYAVVTHACAITLEPGVSQSAEILYEPRVGSQLIINAEQGDSLGVVMIDGSAGWVSRSCVQLTERMIPAAQLEEMLKGGRPDVVQEAMRYLGTPYRYGGRLPYDTDCSLLVQAAFGARGIRLPRTAAEQFTVGHSVSYTELLPGDRLYFVSKSGRINHTGIYLGSGRFVHASSRRKCVTVDSLSDPVYWSRFIGARRS
jgi:LysM repeat protein